VGKLLNEMVRTLAFEATMNMAEGEEPVQPRMLKDLSIAIERLERAATTNIKREEEIRKRALEEAADVVEETAIQLGNDEEQVRYFREKLLGVR